MLSRFEIEGAPLGENSVESEEDEEEVWLFWKDNNKEIRSKSIRELAQDAKEGQKEDQEVVSYYRYLPQRNPQLEPQLLKLLHFNTVQNTPNQRIFFTASGTS